MRYIDQYGRWYCDFCKEYAPAGYTGQSAAPAPAPAPTPAPAAKPAAPVCQKCGQPMSYIKEYDRWYCYTCKEYAPKDTAAPQTATVPVQPVPVAAAPVAPARPQPVSAPVMQAAPQPAARPTMQRVPSHSHSGNPAAGGWFMLLGFLLVLTDEMIYILLATGSITMIPPFIGGALPVYGAGLGSLLGIIGILIFMIGGVMTALAAKIKF